MSASPAAATQGLQSLPLSPLDGAEELLLHRLETVSPNRYFEGLRFAYRLACFNAPQDGPLIADLVERFPPRGTSKSPLIVVSSFVAAVRDEIGLPSSAPVGVQQVRQWLRLRERALRDGRRSSLLDDAERSTLLPPWDPLESTCRHASLSIL